MLQFNKVGDDMIKLRRTTIEDVDLLLKLDKQPSTQKYLGGIKNKTKDERILFLTKKELNKNAYTVLLDNILIGFVELKVSGEYGEVSYIFDCEYWGNGYATDSIKQLLDKAFNELKLNYVLAHTLYDNVASIRVLEKNNFSYKTKVIKNGSEFLEYIILGDKGDRN